MNKPIFYKSRLLSFYIGEGIFYFKILGIGISFKDILKCKFDPNVKKSDGILISKWLIKII